LDFFAGTMEGPIARANKKAFMSTGLGALVIWITCPFRYRHINQTGKKILVKPEARALRAEPLVKKIFLTPAGSGLGLEKKYTYRAKKKKEAKKMKVEGYVIGELHEIRQGKGKESGKPFRILVLRDSDNYQRHERFLSPRITLPPDLKPGCQVKLGIELQTFRGNSDFVITSLAKVS